MVKHWKEFEDEIQALYLNERWSLKEVQSYMKNKHGFSASMRSYRAKLDEWGCKRRDLKVQKRIRKEHSSDYGLVDDSATAIESPEGSNTQTNPQAVATPEASESISATDYDSEDNRPRDDIAVFNAAWHAMTPDVSTRDARGRTKLHLEAKFGTNVSFNDVLGQITDIDAVVRSQDCSGDTPLHMALWAKTPNHSVIKLLLASGSDVNIKNGEGYTPFHILFWRAPVGGITIHHPDLLLAFLGNGAEVSIPTPTGSLPFEIFLNDYFNNSSSPGSSAVNYPVFEAFLAKGGNPDTKVQSGEYVLSQYLRYEVSKRPEPDKCWQIAKLLCLHANVNQVGANGDYPIHDAVRNVQHHSHAELVSVLLHRGANPNQANAAGELPLTVLLSAQSEPSEIVSIISMFGKAGAAALHLRSSFFTALRLYDGGLRRNLIRLILLIEADTEWTESLGNLNKWWVYWSSACFQRCDWIRANRCIQEGISALSLNPERQEVVLMSAKEVVALRCLDKAKEDIKALDTKDVTSEEAQAEYERKEDALRKRCDDVFAMLADFQDTGILAPSLWCDLLLRIYELRPGPKIR